MPAKAARAISARRYLLRTILKKKKQFFFSEHRNPTNFIYSLPRLLISRKSCSSLSPRTPAPRNPALDCGCFSFEKPRQSRDYISYGYRTNITYDAVQDRIWNAIGNLEIEIGDVDTGWKFFTNSMTLEGKVDDVRKIRNWN